MAQYYQVTSLEELHRLYPNLQIDNLEGISCMIQDDQVAQFTEAQGQQVISAVDQTGMPLSQNPNMQQCTSQPSQFVVQQPTQYVIQQMDTCESQTPTVQYIPKRHQSTQQEDKVPEIQFKNQSVGCVKTEITGDENSLHHCITSQEVSQQFVNQIHPIIRQPVQIHQQIQAIDMGGNILVLQNPEQQNIIIDQNTRSELIVNENKDEKQQQHIIIPGQLQSKPQQILTQKPLNVLKDEASMQQYAQQQLMQGNRTSQVGAQQPQIIHQPSQIIQQLQYYNHVTVIDSFSQPNVTVEHPSTPSETSRPQAVSQLQQQIGPLQQFKSNKAVQSIGSSTLIQQPPQVIMPRRFEIGSPTPLPCKVAQQRRKNSQEEAETPPGPVFIVQKVESPFFIRQPQTKIRFQTPSVNENVTEESFQPASVQKEVVLGSAIEDSQKQLQPQQLVTPHIEIQQQNMNATDLPSTGNKFSADKISTNGQVKVELIEQSFGGRSDPNKCKVLQTTVTRNPALKLKNSEQQTEPMVSTEGRDNSGQSLERISNAQVQESLLATLSPSQLPVQIPSQCHTVNQNQSSNRGRGRSIHNVQTPRGAHQFSSRGRGAYVQTSPPHAPNIEDSGNVRRLKSPRGGARGGRGGWTACEADQRQLSPVQLGVSQTVQTSTNKEETIQGSNENLEEARMVVFFLNGEKKIIKIPCSQQNILLGQILQQSGVQFTSPTSLSIEQVVDGNVDQFIIKTDPANIQQQTSNKTSSASQTITAPNSVSTLRSIVNFRPRAQVPNAPQGPTVGIVRHRLHFANPRVSTSSTTTQVTGSLNSATEVSTIQSQNTQCTISSQPSKEEPRFVKGFMAICPFCGISSLDFNKCIRCRRKLPENVKSQSIFNAKRKKLEKATTSEAFGEAKSKVEKKQSDSFSSDGKEKTASKQNLEKKKPKPSPKKKKLHDEPAEILILSSDEEEDTKVKKNNSNQQQLAIIRKEPVYVATELPEAEINVIMKESNLNEDLMKNVQPGLFTTFQCRTIRIGSYKVQPKERVLISSKGIQIIISSLKNENAAIVIPIMNIVKILAHFGRQIPVIFIYPLPKVGFQIRNLLGMDNKAGPYYDPASVQEETHKRITLLLDKISEDNKITLGRIFGPAKLEELTEKEANEILIRASPVDVHISALGKATDSIRKIMVYPPPPEKGGITLNNLDYACLGEDQFLNDVIIDFYLKYLLLRVLSPEDRNRTHVFSTFFYKRLTTKPKTMQKNDPENDPKLSPAEKRHMRVKGWTKQVNLFEKDFIIVPINEHSHWFLAIICFPGLTGPVRFSDNTPVEFEEVIQKKNTQSVQIGNTTITQIIKADGSTISFEMDPGSDRDEAEGDQDDLHPSSDDEETEQEEDASSQSVQIPLLTSLPQQQPLAKEPKSKICKKKCFKEPIKQPCILIFDSLAGASRVRVVATLRDYLKIEYKKKMGQDRDFSKNTIKGAVPKVPQQNNFTDCGLYVLQYVESFFQNPLHDFKLPLKYLKDWFPEEIVSSKRQNLASLIRSLMEEQGLNVEEMGLPVLTFTDGNNVADDSSRMDEEDEDEDEEEMYDEVMKKRIQISGFDNEEDEEMELGEDEDDEDEGLDEEDEDEELEVGEIPRRWLAKARASVKHLQSNCSHIGGRVLIKTSALVDYDPSDSDEEEQNSSTNVICANEASVRGEIGDESEYCGSEQALSESKKSVPLTELQDFESQISCSTIEKHVDGKSSETDMIISEGEEESYEEGASFEVPEGGSTDSESNCINESLQSIDKRHLLGNEVLIKDSKTLGVSDILQKLVNDKNITICRKEDGLNSNLIKKVDIQKFKVKDCDKSEKAVEAGNSCPSLKNSLANCKRSYQTLKSVRIPKKTDRKIEVCNKRQKIDER